MNLKTKALVQKTLAKFGLQVQRLPSDEPNPIHQWEKDERFNALMKQVDGYTLVDKIRCFMAYQFSRQAAHLRGDVAEIGVYKGGTAKLLAKVFEASGKTIHLFDTFSGMPQTDSNKDHHKSGDFSDTSLESVKAYLRDSQNVRFYPGVFPDTASPIEDKNFCLVHVDVDIFQSVLDCCKFFYPRVEKSGIMLFDDYGFLSCPGAKIAVDEFFANKPEQPCYMPTGQCFVVKL